jgi:DNA-binding MarR family transcriptional regulator
MNHPNTLLMRIVLVALLAALLLVLPAVPGADALPDLRTTTNGSVSVQESSGIPPDVESRVETTVHHVEGTVENTVDGLPLPTGAVTQATSEVTALVEQQTETVQAASQGEANTRVGGLTNVEIATGGAAVAAGGAGLLFWAKNGLGLALARMIGFPLFSRLSKDDLLENDGREMLFNLVDSNPGIGLAQLADQSGLGWGTTVYHLGRLEQGGFISSMKNGQNRHFFKNGHPAAQQKKAIAVLKNDTAAQLARYLMATPGATGKTIANGLGIAAPTVTKYVKRLEEEGLVETLREGRSKIVQPTTLLVSAMEHIEAPLPEMPTAPKAIAPGGVSAYA